MQHISRTLWISLFTVLTLMLLAWIAFSQQGKALPAKVLEKMVAGASSFEQSLVSKPAPTSKTITTPPTSALPQTTTYYRWTDDQGQIGYSADLPENVSSFKAIVLDRQPELNTHTAYP